MNKATTTTSPAKRFGILAAAALACTLAAHGCTTNRTPGMGQPERAPAVGPTTPSSTPGTSGGTNGQLDLPMASSYVTPDTGIATMTPFAHQGRYLGRSNPAPEPQAPQQAQTGQYVSPANPYDAAVVAGTPVVGTPAAVVSDLVIPSTGSSGVTIGSTALLTPANAAGALTAGQFASGPSARLNSTASATKASPTSAFALTPTMSSAVNVSPNMATNTSAANVRTTTSSGVTITNNSTGVPSQTIIPSTAAPTTRSSSVGVARAQVSASALTVARTQSGSLVTTVPVTITQTSSGRVRAVATPTTPSGGRVRAVQPTSTMTTTTPTTRVRAVRTSGGIVITNEKP